MGLFGLLLFISTANLVCASWDDVKFAAEVLEPDLSAIEKYYINIDENIQAYIHWPKGIVFHVQKEWITDKKYLKIAGNFKIKTKKLFPKSEYTNLYFKDGIFYVPSQKTIMMKTIPQAAKVHYIQDRELPLKGDTYLSIQYNSLEEVEKAIEPIYAQNKFYFQCYSKKMSVTYIVTLNEPTKHFLEFVTFSTNGKLPTCMSGEWDGKLLALIGKVENQKGSKNVKVTRKEEAGKLVFDQTSTSKPPRVLPLPDCSSPASIENVFGIRMLNIGFLTEVRKNKIKFLNTADLDLRTSPPGHKISARSLLEKAKTVEPISCESNDESVKLRPKIGKFQMYGHFLTKKMNFLRDGVNINKECPYVIEYELGVGSSFEFGTTETKQICTDNENLWVDTFNGDATNNSNEDVTLFHP